MDLHGLAVLMRAARRERAHFSVARPAACVLRLLELIHADGEVPILPDGSNPLDAALGQNTIRTKGTVEAIAVKHFAG